MTRGQSYKSNRFLSEASFSEYFYFKLLKNKQTKTTPISINAYAGRTGT